MVPAVVIYLFFCPLVCGQYQNRRPNVFLPQGSIVGTKVYSDSGRIADAYFGLPYAAPPVDHLRFAPPQKHPGWNGTLHALNPGPKCPQLPLKSDQSDNTNEDCLYLNIWSPENAQKYGPIPVVIVLEGIEFSRTNQFHLPGLDLAMEGVVIVTLNYRLNVFGFLSLGSKELRGNFGLLDQYFAMLWVKENIKHFGGDPDKITLFGHAAGAASVAYHMISPRTKGLFHRAIFSSGSVLSPWHIATNNFKPSEKVIQNLGCFGTYSATILSCLRSKRTVDILKAYEEFVESGYFSELFLPVIDVFLPQNEQYLPKEPIAAFRDNNFLQMPILTGTAKVLADPQFKIWEDISKQGTLQLQQYFEQSKIAEAITRYQFGRQNKEEIIELIKWHYMDPRQSNANYLLEQLKLLDFESKIEAPHYVQLNQLVSTFIPPVYAYSIEDVFFNFNNTEYFLTSDLILLFGPFLLNQIARRRFTANEMRLSKRLKEMWTNFIIFGNPTPNGNNNNMKLWKKYAANDYYVETLKTISPSEDISRVRRVTFWTHLLPKLSVSRYSPNNNPREYQLSPDPAAGYKHALYTLVALAIGLLALLLVCIVLLKRRNKETERHFHMGY